MKSGEVIWTAEQDWEPTCPACDGPVFVLGKLGGLTHFRCRDCGWTFNDEQV